VGEQLAKMPAGGVADHFPESRQTHERGRARVKLAD